MSDQTWNWIVYAIIGLGFLVGAFVVKRPIVKPLLGVIAFAFLLTAAIQAFKDPVFWIVIVVMTAIFILSLYLKRRKARRDHEREEERDRRGPQIHIHNHH